MTGLENSVVGEAYGFFYCSASREEIAQALPEIRKRTSTPRELMLFLVEGMENVQGESDLVGLAQEAKEDRRNYMLRATLPDSTNRQTADELAAILNNLYASHLYAPGEPFWADVVCRTDDGEWEFRG